jgi:hypothetical protein
MLQPFLFFGRDGVIRTHDPLHPMQVRYQAALRPDERKIIPEPRCIFAIYEFEIHARQAGAQDRFVDTRVIFAGLPVIRFGVCDAVWLTANGARVCAAGATSAELDR